MIQISYRGDMDNQVNIIVIDLNDKHANECFHRIQALRKKESDGTYWAYRSLTFQNNNNQTKTIDIYPLTPFLAEGEEIIWHRTNAVGKSYKKVEWIQAFTNYRVFHYDYKQYAGAMVLLPALEDVLVSNQRRTSHSNSSGFYSRSYYNSPRI